MATAEELRRLREEQSIFSALYDMARQQQSELAAEGRRPVLGGLLSKEPVYGTDTLRYEGIGDMLVGLLSPAAKAVDAPISAYRGTIPQEDMISEALGVGGLAMAGGGAVGVPRGAVGANAADLRRQANIDRFGYDPNEAPEVDTSYRGGHQPVGPQDENPVRLDDVTISTTGEQAGYPSDFYSGQGQRLYAQGPRFADDEFGLSNQQSYRAIQAARGNPDAEVTIYRGVPNEESITSINAGDFVTLSPKYAELHASSGYGPRGEDAGKVISQKVKVKDVYFAGDDVNEFGYFPDATAANASKSTGLLTTAASEGRTWPSAFSASEVTDEMMAQADPQYMFANTQWTKHRGWRGPRPLGLRATCSTVARAVMKMRTDAGTGKTSGTGAFLTPTISLQKHFSCRRWVSLPINVKIERPKVNADMQNWNNIESPVYAFDPKTWTTLKRRQSEQMTLQERPAEAIEIHVSDRGPRAWGMTQYPGVSR